MPTLKARIGGQWVTVGGTVSKADIEKILTDAQKYADQLWDELDDELNELNRDLGDTRDYINGAFKDGVISETEARKIQTYLNTLDSAKRAFDEEFLHLRDNAKLSDSLRADIITAKNNYDEKYLALVTAINTAIEDMLTTPEEAQAVNLAFYNYNDTISVLVAILKICTEYIGQKMADEATDASKTYTDGLFGPMQTQILNMSTQMTQTDEKIEFLATKDELKTKVEEATGTVSKEAKDYADSIKASLDADIDTLEDALTDFDGYIDGSFKDGVISSAEAFRIQGYINTLTSSKNLLDNQYAELYNNTYLTGSAKSNLANAKTGLDTAHTNLISAINTAISDSATTPEESADVDAKFALYNDAIKIFTARVQQAIDAVALAKSKEAEKNAKDYTDNEIAPIQNTLTEYDSRFTVMAGEIEQMVTVTKHDADLKTNLDLANKYVDDTKILIESDISDLTGDLGDLSGYVDGAFKDGIVYESEAKKIQSYINTLQMSKNQFDNRYNEVYANVDLTGQIKTDLNTAKTDYNNKYTALIEAINNAIADGKSTQAEADEVNTKFSAYNGTVSVLSKLLEKAVDAIGKKKADAASADAKTYADGLAQSLEDTIDDLNVDIGDLNTYIDQSFRDGVISEAEAKKIQAILKIIQDSKGNLDNRYTPVYASTYLAGTAKTNLSQKKSDYDTAYNTLLSSINNAIADGKATQAESAQVDTNFSDYNARLKSLVNAIEVAVDYIAKAKADEALNGAKGYTDGIKSAIDTRISTAEASIKNNGDAIEARVTKEMYAASVIGIRNKLIRTGFRENPVGSGTFEHNLGSNVGTGVVANLAVVDEPTAPTKKAMKITRTDTVTVSGGRYWYTGDRLVVGSTWSWGIWVKGTGTWQIGHEQGGQKNVTLTDTWQYITNTFVANSSQYSTFTFYRVAGSNAGGEIIFHSLLLSEGDKLTGVWVPALEDTDTRISNAESLIKQNADNILLRVSKDGVIGAINLSSEEAVIAFEKINFKGKVTYEAFASDAKAKIDSGVSASATITSNQAVWGRASNINSDGTLDTSKLNGSVKPDQLTTSSPNLLYDVDSFEQIPNKNPFGSGGVLSTCITSAEEAYHGKYSLKTVNSGANSYKYLHPTATTSVGWITLNKGRYLLSAYAKTTADTVDISLVPVVRQGDTTTSLTNNFANTGVGWSTATATIKNTDGWVRLSAAINISDLSQVPKLTFYVRTISATSSTVYWDAIQLEFIGTQTHSTPSAFTPGGTTMVDASALNGKVSDDNIGSAGNWNSAKTMVDEISSDNKITPSEKKTLKIELDAIVKEKAQGDALADSLGIVTEKTAYGNAYTALYNYLNPLLSNLSTTSDINGATNRTYFNNYYDAAAKLQTAIQAQQKALADKAQRDIDGLQIGARNLALDTKTSKTATGTGGTNQTTTLYDLSIPYADIANKQITISFDIVFTASTGTAVMQWNSTPWGSVADRIDASATKKHYSFTKTQPADGLATAIAIRLDNFTGTATVTNLKIEFGNRETTWSPAPEDVDNMINFGSIYVRGTGSNRGGNRILKVNEKQIYNTGGRGLRITALNRSDLSVAFDQNYDVYTAGTPQDDFANKLNSFDDSVIVVVSSFDAIKTNTTNIFNALTRIGGSGTYLTYRNPFALIGIPGIGRGAGLESFTAGSATDNNAEISCKVINGVPQGINTASAQIAKDVQDKVDTNSSIWNLASNFRTDGTLDPSKIFGTVPDNKIAGATNWNYAKDAVNLWQWQGDKTVINGGVIGTDTIFAKSILMSDFTNLVENPTFESDTVGSIPRGWYVNSGTPYARVKDITGFGSGNGSTKAFEIDARNGANSDVFTDTFIPVTEGQKFYLEGQGRYLNTAGSGYAFIGIREYDSQKNHVAWNVTASWNDSTKITSFNTRSGVYTVGAGVAFIKFRASFLNNGETTNKFYLDNLRFHRMANAELIVDGVIEGRHVKADSLTFDKAKGGILRLGGADNENGKLEVYNSDGDLIADLDGNRGGFSDLTVANLNAPNVLSYNSSSFNLYVSDRAIVTGGTLGAEPDDNNEGDGWARPIATINEALRRIPQYNDGTIVINLAYQSVLYEDVVIAGYIGNGSIKMTGGQVKVNGNFTIKNNINNILINDGNTATLTINGRAGSYAVCSITQNSYVRFENTRVYGSGSDMNFNSTQGYTELINCETYTCKYGISSRYGATTYIEGCKGKATEIGLHTYGGYIVGTGTAPEAPQAYAEIRGGTIGGRKNAADAFTYPVTAVPTPPATPDITKTWSSVGGNSWRDNYGGQWYNQGIVAQGTWSGFGTYRGLWFIDSNMASTLSGKTIKKMRIYVTRTNSGGYSSPVTVYFRAHGYASQPSGVPSLGGVSYGVTFKWGEGKWVNIPSSMWSGFTNGTFKGFGIYVSGSGLDKYYARFGTSCKVEVTYA